MAKETLVEELESTESIEGIEGTEGQEGIEAGESRQSIIESAVNDAEAQERIDALAANEAEPTIDQLKEAFGDLAEGLTDAELQAEWDKAQGKEAGAEGTGFTLPNGLKLYGEDGKELTGLEKMTVAQIFSDKVQFGYNALGKEQKKALAEVFRNASLGHYNEQKMQTLAQERTSIYDKYTKLNAEHASWAQDRQVWLSVLTAAANGNVDPLKQLIKEYGAANAQAGVTGPQATIDPSQEAEFNDAGMQWVTAEANKLAQTYGANPLEIAQAIVYMANQEPQEFLTQEKLNAIVQYEIPALLERYNYSVKVGGVVQAQGTADPRDAKIATMERQLAELTAGQKNAQTQRLRERKVPAAGGGRTSAAGDTVPAFKSREDYKKWIRGD